MGELLKCLLQNILTTLANLLAVILASLEGMFVRLSQTVCEWEIRQDNNLYLKHYQISVLIPIHFSSPIER
jgi:hypothetical protein